jgi:hypothetical protein
MKKVKTVDKVVQEEQIEDITCDICLESCRDSLDMNFECLSISTKWGYGSNNKDGEKWEAHVCESCTEKYLKDLILFNKSSYFSKSHELHEEMNEVNNRKRKIRKVVGLKVDVKVDKEDEI